MNSGTNPRKFARLFIALIIGSQLLWAGSSISQASDYQQDRIILAALTSGSKQAAEFELKDTEGATVKLSQFKGNKPVFLYFWATWCDYCVKAKPQIAKLREKIPTQDLEMLGINVGKGDSLEKVQRFLKGHPAPYPILYDESSKVSMTYQIQGIPTYVIVDKEGKIAYYGNTLPADPMEYLK